MCSKRRTLNALVISIKGCPIKATVMSTLDHQSQTFHSSNQPLNSRLLRKLPLLLPRSSHQSFRQHPAPSQPLPVPLIVVTPPQRPITPGSQKRPWLQTIPEEDEDNLPEPQRVRFQSSSSSDNFNTPPDTSARPGDQVPRKFDHEDLPSAFGHLALSLDANLPARRDEILTDVQGEGAT